MPSEAAAVVADHIKDERIIELAEILNRLNHADFMVGVAAKAGEDLHLPGEKPFFVGGEGIRVLMAAGLGGEHRSRGNHAQGDLPGERLVELIPPLVELALEFGDPLLRRVTRGACVRQGQSR